MKRYLFIIVGLLFLVGCSTKEENEKYAYLEYKNDSESQDVYDEEDSLDFDTYFNIIRNKDDNEKVDYSIVIDKPEINMYNVKALLVHDYMNEDAFPSVGIVLIKLSLMVLLILPLILVILILNYI